jgi:hypothetical protein
VYVPRTAKERQCGWTNLEQGCLCVFGSVGVRDLWFAGRDWVKDCFGRGVQIDGTLAQLPAFIPLVALPEFPSDPH